MNRRKFLQVSAGGVVLVFSAACQPQQSTGSKPTPTVSAGALPTVEGGPSAGIVQSGAPTVDPDLAHLKLDLPVPLRTTSIDHFYVTNYSSVIPGFDPATWSLVLEGLVEQPLKFTYDELRALPAVELMRTLECIGNSVGGPLISNGKWKGTSLKALLEKARVKAGATHLIFDGTDDYFTAVPISIGQTEQAVLAYELNGNPLTPEHGRPVRVLLPGVYGQKQPKWLSHIQVADHYEKGPWERKGWSDTCIIQPNSRVDRPLDGNVVTGRTGDIFTITGIAFTGSAGAAKVEVSTDGGETWNNATLTQAPAPDTNYAWTEWGWDWKLPAGGDYTILARVTDKAGNTQGDPTKQIFFGSFPNGTNAIQTVNVQVKNS